MQRSDWAPIPILLRTKMEIGEVVPDPEDKRSVSVEKVIPPERVELWWRGWVPVSSADWVNADLHYRLGEEGYEDWEGSPVGDKMDDVLADAEKLITPRAA